MKPCRLPVIIAGPDNGLHGQLCRSRFRVPERRSMALFGSVSSKDIDKFAKTLAEDVAKQYPPALDKEGERRLSDKRLTRILEEICNKAAAFKIEHNLGVYKKARLGNTFRWELEELGYSKQFIETATEGLIVYLTRKN
jgi:hypothetical protein